MKVRAKFLSVKAALGGRIEEMGIKLRVFFILALSSRLDSEKA
jgi:hypothetical protein